MRNAYEVFSEYDYLKLRANGEGPRIVTNGT
jgi:hypothetical protein